MVSPLTPAWRPQTLIMPHGVGSVVSVQYKPPVDAPEWLCDDDYAHSRYLLDSEQHLEHLQHDAIARFPLSLTKVAILNSPPRARKGLKGMSRQTGNKIKASAAVLERSWGRDRLSFVTLTLPPEALLANEDSGKTICGATWGDLLHRFNVSLRRLLERQGVKPEWVQCSEVQEGRYKRTGKVALHAHYLVGGRNGVGMPWAVSITDFRSAWARAIEATIGRPLSTQPVVDVQRVKKSCVAYLGKYLSKGGEIVDAVIEGGDADQLPSHWWGSTAALKAEVVRQTIRDGKDLSDWMWELCWQNSPEYFRYCFPVMVDRGDGEALHLGFTFELQPEFYEKLRESFLPS